MLTIRDAVIDDVPDIVNCGQRFFEYAKFPEHGLTLDPMSFIKKLINNIQSENGVMLALCNDDNKFVGGISGWVVPWETFNENITVALEFFFWVEPQYRGIKSVKMFKMYEQRVKDLGAQRSFMIDVNTNLSDGVRNLYSRMGYNLIESFHVKNLVGE